MTHLGPKACITTRSDRGLPAFQQLLQSGIHPMAGCCGGEAMEALTQRAKLIGAANRSLAGPRFQSPSWAPR